MFGTKVRSWRGGNRKEVIYPLCHEIRNLTLQPPAEEQRLVELISIVTGIVNHETPSARVYGKLSAELFPSQSDVSRDFPRGLSP